MAAAVAVVAGSTPTGPSIPPGPRSRSAVRPATFTRNICSSPATPIPSGDRVMAENYLQHAEHYFRIMAAQQAQQAQYQAQQAAQNANRQPGDQPATGGLSPSRSRAAAPPSRLTEGGTDEEEGEDAEALDFSFTPISSGKPSEAVRHAAATELPRQAFGHGRRKSQPRRASFSALPLRPGFLSPISAWNGALIEAVS